MTRQAEPKPCMRFVSSKNSISNTVDFLTGKVSREELRVREYLDVDFVLQNYFHASDWGSKKDTPLPNLFFKTLSLKGIRALTVAADSLKFQGKLTPLSSNP